MLLTRAKAINALDAVSASLRRASTRGAAPYLLAPPVERAAATAIARELSSHSAVASRARAEPSSAHLLPTKTPIRHPPSASTVPAPGAELRVSARAAAARTKILHGLGAPLREVELVTGSGSWLTTSAGDKLLDFTSGIGVTNLGHCHPAVVSACQAQVASLMHAQPSVALSKPFIELTERLVASVLPRGLSRVVFSTTGAEAVENAVRLARAATRRPNVICFQGAYHGRTQGTLALTSSRTSYGLHNQPRPGGAFVAPFPYESQAPGLGVAGCLFQLELLLKQQTAPEDTAAMIIEPVLGEGGYVPADPAFLRELRSLCDRHGIVLIFDEVQTGFGRTGRMLALEHSGVVPDVLVLAKGIASGMPLSAVATREDLSAKCPAGSMGGTYSGNAVSCAAALATLDVFEREGVVANAQARGAQLVALLQGVAQRLPRAVKEVRGLGLMVGMELRPGLRAGISREVSLRCAANEGLLLMNGGWFETLRFIPPLTVSEAEVAEGVRRFERGLVGALEAAAAAE